MPLQVGVLVHKLLHAYYTGSLTVDMITHLPEFIKSTYKENSEELTEEVVSQAATLFQGYLNRWKDDPFKVISSEIWVEAEMPNFIVRGKVDAIARNEDNKLWRLEHKTTARMDSAYLNGLRGGLQGTIYDFLLEYLFKEQVEGTIYNLIVKTKIPQYDRSFARADLAMRSRVFETLEGVTRDIHKGDFYPSSECFTYNRVCGYKILCDHDSPDARDAFYTQRTVTD
jgi:hypothetical protein